MDAFRYCRARFGVGSAGQHCCSREIAMTRIRIGLDIAKNVFQAHGVDDNGTVVLRKRLHDPTYYGSLLLCHLA